jgi:hypothetical protein
VVEILVTESGEVEAWSNNVVYDENPNVNTVF